MSETPFHSLDDFIALRRLSNLVLSPDGQRLVVAAQQLNAAGTAWGTALWEVDPAGEQPAVRLTRSAPGESQPGFTPSGELVFVSRRPDPDAGKDNGKNSSDDKAQLWVLPQRGEAKPYARRPGGISGFAVARDNGALVVGSSTMPSATSAAEDRAARKHRSEHEISALLHAGEPVRFWDHDLGPDRLRLFVAAGRDEEAVATATTANGDDASADDDTDDTDDRADLLQLRDLTPRAGDALFQASYDIGPDGATVVSTWRVPLAGGDARVELRSIECSGAGTQVLASDAEHDFGSPAISPDGRFVVARRARHRAAGQPPVATLWLVDLQSGEQRALAGELDLIPQEPCWSPDGRTVFFTADQQGRCPVFAVDVEGGAVRRVVADAAYSDLQVSRDGAALYALRSAVDAPPEPVRLDPAGKDQEPVVLPGPQPRPTLPGSLTEVFGQAEDGTALRAWLALPATGQDDGAGEQAPLLLWIHGGPYNSWNAWQWRWNPWPAVARGYAVLLPDPALSTGYGEDFLWRGFGRWGDKPYTDLMTITDVALGRSEVDASRTAAMGGSFGGYMANWIAGHTDRFRAIVTHASLWALDQFAPTTDFSAGWFGELATTDLREFSPERFKDTIVTPMLVIHGDKDYRVPIGEGLRLWNDLVRGWQGEPDQLPHRFLYFPNENHWVLTPQHAKLWYEAVFSFLSWHLLDGEFDPPAPL